MSSAAAVILLVGRILFIVYFASAAVGHLRSGEMMVQYAKSKNAPLAQFGGWPVGVWLALASVSILLGVWPDIGALMIIAWVILPTIFIHNWWAVTDAQQKMTEQLNFSRNITFIGAALALFAAFVTLGSELKLTITGPLFHF